MFHNVLRVFHDVLLVVHNVLRCITMFYVFHDVLQRFMFSELWNERRRRIGDSLMDLDNAAGIGDNSAEISDGAAGIVNITANVIPC